MSRNPRWHYKNAPIKEAMLDLRLESHTEITQERLLEFHEAIKLEYPVKTTRQHVELRGSLDVEGEVGATAKRAFGGYFFHNAGNTDIVGVRVDGFSFSRLAPYQTWDSMSKEAGRLWAAFRSIIGESVSTRVALRFINQLDIPSRIVDFKDYLTTSPEVGSALPQGISGYMMQLQIPQGSIDGHEAMLILNQAMVPPPNDETVSIILDIDVFVEGLNISDDTKLWPLIESLRDRKNAIFEGCITDKTRQLIGPIIEVGEDK